MSNAAKHLNAQFQNVRSVCICLPVERRIGHQTPHQRIAEHHADEDESDQRQRLQNQMQHDAVLQEHLSGPLAVNCGKLLLGLNAVVIDAEELAFARFCP